MPHVQQGKLVGEPPTIYDGDRKKTTLFINECVMILTIQAMEPA